MSTARFTRTRIAPTPSGFLHLGNIFSFALTASFARMTGASILLRIDDLDQPRVRPQYIIDLFDTLRFLDIPWDEGPKDYEDYKDVFSQLKRLHLYEKALIQLRESGQVFACSCSRTTNRNICTCRDKNISLDEPGNAWRLHTPASAVLPASMYEFIVKKKDGMPSYQLACVVDDQHFGIDLIVRGKDLEESSRAQLYLAGVLGYTSFINSTIIHHRLIMESAHQKLSKSAGSTSLQLLRQQGKSSGEIYEMISIIAGCKTIHCQWQDFAGEIDW